MAHSPLSSETSAEARHRLRLALSRFYRLEQFDLFFTPSLHVAQVLLSQLFLRQEQARNQNRYASHFPVTELNILPAVPLIAGNIIWCRMSKCPMVASVRCGNAIIRA